MATRNPAQQHFNLCIQVNNTNHRTEEITTKRLIVRRGQDFTISLHKSINGGSELKKDDITFIIGTETPYGKKKVFDLSSSNIKNEWNASIISEDKTSMEIKIFPPADAIIGLHTLSVQISDVRQARHYRLGEFIILFNAWSPDDSVFLQDEEERKEYVLNENGFIFVGNAKHISKCSWNFGQFEEDIVDICLKLLDKSAKSLKNPLKDYTKRHDPVYVSRVLSAMINCNDDRGVLLGRWNGNYDDGTSPTKWNGSVSILRQWCSSAFQPVKYGQCWVFAAVLCTALRCLGIPARVVTNFNSAHDTDGNLSIDEYYDISGEMISRGRRDSVWNFHVWNEGWMKRRDLIPEYSGWQALDATPQETSHGVFCCGPAPVEAIKEGDIYVDHDCSFIFAEVNADIVHWLVRSDRETPERFFQDNKEIGRLISTKAVGSDGRMDITSNYKYEEGSEKERLVFNKALEVKKKPQSTETGHETLVPSPPVNTTGIQLKLKLKESPIFGQDVQLIALLRNLTSLVKKMNLNINVQTMENNGVPISVVYQKSDSVELQPNAEHAAEYLVPYSLYKASITDSNLFKVSAVGELTDTKEKLLAERKITLDSPSLQVEKQGNAILYSTCKVTVTFVNPLHEELKNCELLLEGNGLVFGHIEQKLRNLKPGGRLQVNVNLVPYKSGNKTLQVLFTSDKIKHIREHLDIRVLSP